MTTRNKSVDATSELAELRAMVEAMAASQLAMMNAIGQGTVPTPQAQPAPMPQTSVQPKQVPVGYSVTLADLETVPLDRWQFLMTYGALVNLPRIGFARRAYQDKDTGQMVQPAPGSKYQQDPAIPFNGKMRSWAGTCYRTRKQNLTLTGSLTEDAKKSLLENMSKAIEAGVDILGNGGVKQTATTGQTRGRRQTQTQTPVAESVDLDNVSDKEIRATAKTLGISFVAKPGRMAPSERARLLKAIGVKQPTSQSSAVPASNVKLDSFEKSLVRELKLRTKLGHTNGKIASLASKLGVPDVSNKGYLVEDKVAAIVKAARGK